MHSTPIPSSTDHAGPADGAPVHAQTAMLSEVARDAGQEIRYETAELIYSRTDERGVIRAANDVFQRLAAHDWNDLIGAPHKIIRHPDMPRGFFHMFWKLLKSGEPAIGYVKNRCKDGRHYWVLAAAIPCEGGYFSVRMKPTSPLFHTLRDIYAALRRREDQDKLSAEASAEVLLGRLTDLGFHSYGDFMCQALQAESKARDAALSYPADELAGQMGALIAALGEALEEQNRLVALFQSLTLLPVNMRLIAARLEPQGGPISQISMNYKTSFDAISESLTRFVSGKGNICGQMDHAIRRGLILRGCSRLHAEVEVNLRHLGSNADLFADGSGFDTRQEHRFAQALGQECNRQVQRSLEEAQKLATTLNGAAYEIRRMVLGLDTIRILGRVESRRDAAFDAACSATLDQIDSVQGSISASLQRLSNLALTIQSNLATINAQQSVNARVLDEGTSDAHRPEGKGFATLSAHDPARSSRVA